MKGVAKALNNKLKAVMQRVQDRVQNGEIKVNGPRDALRSQPTNGPQGAPSGSPGFPAPPIAQGVVSIATMMQGMMMSRPTPISPQMIAGTGPQAAAVQMQMQVYSEFAAMTMQYPAGGYGVAPMPIDTGFLGAETMVDEFLTDEVQAMIETQVQEQLQSMFMQELRR